MNFINSMIISIAKNSQKNAKFDEENEEKSEIQLFNGEKNDDDFWLKLNFEIEERCKRVHCVDLGESFPTSIYLQKSASTQPRTSPVKFVCSSCTDPPGYEY